MGLRVGGDMAKKKDKKKDKKKSWKEEEE